MMVAFLEKLPTAVYLGFPIAVYLVAFLLLRRRDGPWWLLSSLSFFFAAATLSYGINAALAFREGGLVGEHTYGDAAFTSFWAVLRLPLLVALSLAVLGIVFAVYPRDTKARRNHAV